MSADGDDIGNRRLGENNDHRSPSASVTPTSLRMRAKTASRHNTRPASASAMPRAPAVSTRPACGPALPRRVPARRCADNLALL